MSFTIQMMFCEDTMLREIADPRCKRKTVAKTYAFALKSGEDIDWAKVNAAIVKRWSRSALHWIKDQAWTGKCFSATPPAKPKETEGRGI